MSGFFFQAEDGIRDVAVTGVQTCALPISHGSENCNLFSGEPGSVDWRSLRGVVEAEHSQPETAPQPRHRFCCRGPQRQGERLAVRWPNRRRPAGDACRIAGAVGVCDLVHLPAAILDPNQHALTLRGSNIFLTKM